MRRTPHTLARELQQVAPIKLDLVPYQKHRPATTTWWLVRNPKSKVPQHDRAKFMVTPWADDALFVGWGVEKGRGPTRAARERNPARILTPAWPWHRVLDALETGTIQPTLETLHARSSRPLCLTLDAHRRPHRERWVFVLHPGGTLHLHRTQRNEAHPLLHDLQRVTTLTTLAHLLPLTPDPGAYDAVWLELYIGRVYATDPPPTAPHALFEETLSPWVPRL